MTFHGLRLDPWECLLSLLPYLVTSHQLQDQNYTDTSDQRAINQSSLATLFHGLDLCYSSSHNSETFYYRITSWLWKDKKFRNSPGKKCTSASTGKRARRFMPLGASHFHYLTCSPIQKPLKSNFCRAFWRDLLHRNDWLNHWLLEIFRWRFFPFSLPKRY